jgi:tRNA threonylcarbamoyl adenosine modification protein (Sua5/YciO/YrdC/YwlC family)
MLVTIHPDNPSDRKIQIVCDALRKGEVVIAPTDSVYALICSVEQKKAFERVCQLRHLDPKKAQLSVLFNDFSLASPYIGQLDNLVFKLMKKNLPGPFTFIVDAGKAMPGYLKNKRKAIGFRMPDHPIISAIITELQTPLFVASLRSEDEIFEYYFDPEEIHDRYKKQVSMVIDGGIGRVYPSTIVDCTGNEAEIIRQGAEELIF